MRVPGSAGPGRARDDRPPLEWWLGWLQLVATAIAGGLVLWSTATPGGGSTWQLLVATPVLLCVAIWWVSYLLGTLSDSRQHGRRRVGATVALGWIVTPALVGIVALVVWQDVPLRVGFVLSRGSLERALPDAPEGPIPTTEYVAFGREPIDSPRRLGLYEVWPERNDDGGTYFHTDYGGAGFVHFPDGPPTRAADEPGDPYAPTWQYRALGDGWYVFELDLFDYD